MRVIIDAHQHFWKLERGDYSWLTGDMGVLYQDFLPQDLNPLLEKHQISGTVLVQAAPTYEETKFLLSLYEQYEWIYGVVGWLDLSSLSFREQLVSILKHPGLAGLRPMLQDIEQNDWILQEQVIENLKWMIRYNLPLDLLINNKHISSILTLMETLPDLMTVINHLAKPKISDKGINNWKEEMNALAQFPNVWCKLSGLMTQADPNQWKIEDFKPYIHHIIEIFGPSRIMFGSDWPVCLSAGSYDDAVQIINKCLPDSLSTLEKEQIFSGNAKSFYKLKERGSING
ncbi:amidohydrolase [Cytobacillus firmus]|uniref:amidohydrolase family protein n=1 Tax=Cytobacillus firmus TaxID=1399 RepID=UPI001C8DD65B|nr:amidohydrolase family protein [Cytobacillus firmus]MBX9975865.1 amidohydrolase family protein [Cytobacillus firmus]